MAMLCLAFVVLLLTPTPCVAQSCLGCPSSTSCWGGGTGGWQDPNWCFGTTPTSTPPSGGTILIDSGTVTLSTTLTLSSGDSLTLTGWATLLISSGTTFTANQGAQVLVSNAIFDSSGLVDIDCSFAASYATVSNQRYASFTVDTHGSLAASGWGTTMNNAGTIDIVGSVVFSNYAALNNNAYGGVNMVSPSVWSFTSLATFTNSGDSFHVYPGASLTLDHSIINNWSLLRVLGSLAASNYAAVSNQAGGTLEIYVSGSLTVSDSLTTCNNAGNIVVMNFATATFLNQAHMNNNAGGSVAINSGGVISITGSAALNNAQSVVTDAGGELRFTSSGSYVPLSGASLTCSNTSPGGSCADDSCCLSGCATGGGCV